MLDTFLMKKVCGGCDDFADLQLSGLAGKKSGVNPI